MAQYYNQLEKYRTYNSYAQSYLLQRAERIATMVWRKRTYLMPPMESCMLVIR